MIAGAILRRATALRASVEGESPSGEDETLFQHALRARHFRDGDRFCYAIETTRRGSWIGTDHDSTMVERLVDPIDRRVVRLTL